MSDRLPEFPWDRLRPAADRAAQHPAGPIDLSIGTPVDPVPSLVQHALAAAADSPGYPTTHGTAALREAAVGWMMRRLDTIDIDPEAVLPLIGMKELVALLPFLMGIGQGERVVVPELAYPTYEIGARLVGADVVVTDATTTLGPARVALMWVNSPSNPTGRVLSVDHLRKVVSWGRERGALVVSDECYIELGWDTEPVSILHPDVCGGSSEGLLVLHSLSKRSNLAGYRAGFATGDASAIERLLHTRKHIGMMMPTPVQSAMTIALNDDQHVVDQRARYLQRRRLLLSELRHAGFSIDHSEAGLYLWATRDEPCWDTVQWFADRGVLVAPGDFYGPRGAQHVRIALTASDAAIAQVGARLRD